MNGDDLCRLLCLMAPGMSLTIPDTWIDRHVPGPRVKQAARINEIAQDYGCVVRHGVEVQTFEKLEFPRTG